jgi:protease-4
MTRYRRVGYSLLLGLLLSGCISVDLTRRIEPLRESRVEGQGRAKILVMELSGVISEERLFELPGSGPEVPLLARIREELAKAEQDDRIKAVVLRINSPGGTATASDIVYEELKTFKAKRKIPVIAVIMDVGASGAYYAALAADQIVAHPTAVVGSIGVVMLTMNTEGLLQKVGVTPLAIKSGPKKDMGSPFRGLTDEERAIFQNVIDSLHTRFAELIAKDRRLPIAAVKNLADGRIYTAEEAKRLRLIDQIGYVDDAIRLAKQAAHLDAAVVVVYHRPKEYRATVYSSASTPDRLQGPLAQLGALLLGPGPRFLYLWWP